MSNDELREGVIIAETYRLTRSLGTGGYSSVWGAEHLRLPGNRVAIKFLHLHRMVSEETLARFRREAEITSRLRHANIVQVYDVNTTDAGIPYLVLEYLEGESLGSCIERGPMSLKKTCAIISEAASALDAAHTLRVIHRDLKPDNIFLLSDPPRTKVLDFGISKVLDSTTVQTQEDALLGTPRYMSPEQAGGLPEDVDQTTDVFALGSIAYEMLSGHCAFEGDKLAGVVYRVMSEEPRPLAQARPELGTAVSSAIQGAMAKDKKKRFASASEFAHALADAAGIAPIPPAELDTPNSVESTVSGSQRKVSWLALALAGIGITALVVHFGFGSSQPSPIVATPTMDATPTTSDGPLTRADAMPTDAMTAEASTRTGKPHTQSSSEVRSLVKKANLALLSGDNQGVRSVIQQLYRLKAPGPAQLLEGQLACKAKNLSRANAARRRLPATKKRTLESYCRKQEFALPPR